MAGGRAEARKGGAVTEAEGLQTPKFTRVLSTINLQSEIDSKVLKENQMGERVSPELVL